MFTVQYFAGGGSRGIPAVETGPDQDDEGS